MTEKFTQLTGTMDNGAHTIDLNGRNGNLTMGGKGCQGDVALLNTEGQQTIHLDGGNGNLTMGGGQAQGDVTLLNTEGEQTVHVDGGNGNLTMGGAGSQGDITLMDGNGRQTIHIDGGSGDINMDGSTIKPADYVFTDNYQLLDLREVKSHIVEHGHLPGIPSGQTMQAEGLKLNTFAMQLLEKVEELTLHVIRQEEEIAELKSRLNS